MRLFVAVDLSDDCRRAAADAAAQLAGALDEHVRRPPRIAWIPADRMHITLRFIGDVSDDVAAGIQRAFEPAIDGMAPFDLELSGIGAFPSGGPPRVIWIGVSRGGVELRALFQYVAGRLAPFDLVKEDRPFSAHLTLGRVRDRADKSMHAVLTAARFGPRVSRITHATLYQSRLSPKGPTYVPLVRSSLCS